MIPDKNRRSSMREPSGHVPVLLKETLEFLNATSGQKFIDCTVGFGGHTSAILEANPKNTVLGIDLDQSSLDKLEHTLAQRGLNQRVTLVQGNFKDLEKIIFENEFGLADGVLLDLGFSSWQLDNAERGLSFQADGPLDMRLNLQAKKKAGDVVNSYGPKDLEKVIKDYGEDRFARAITANIIKARKVKKIESTFQLAEIIRASIPAPVRYKANDNIRRVFQALRIEVNGELDSLRTVLPLALKILKPGGRLVVISFHSLEDRIVKEFFNTKAKDCVCPPDFPTCVCDKESELTVLTRKPVIASEEEAKINPRSKSAKLRAAEKAADNS